MVDNSTTRVLVVTDSATPTPALIEAIRHRAETGPAQFRVVVPNPAHSELHLLHPERHDKAREAEQVLHEALPALTEAAGSPVIGSVSVRNDPMDAIEETLLSEPIAEIMLSVVSHKFSARLHQDLQHRLAHLQLPVSVVPHEGGH